MARVIIEDCLKKIPNRFLLCNIIRKRVKQIRDNSKSFINSSSTSEDIIIALREIAAGKKILQKEQEKKK